MSTEEPKQCPGCRKRSYHLMRWGLFPGRACVTEGCMVFSFPFPLNLVVEFICHLRGIWETKAVWIEFRKPGLIGYLKSFPSRRPK